MESYMPTQAQFLFLMFRAADSSDNAFDHLLDAAYEHAAASDSPNGPDYHRAVEDFYNLWINLYGQWVESGRPTLVDTSPDKHFWEDHEFPDD
jgi:hypothetical protein